MWSNDTGEEELDRTEQYKDRANEFARNFLGYGTYQAPFWFVGLEEGGGDSAEELARRINAWHSRGRRELEDLVDYHSAIGITQWLNPGPTIQPTWKGYIRTLLAARGLPTDPNAVRQYQASRFGRADGETCLLEINPLCRPSTEIPAYAIGTEGLTDPETVRARYTQARVDRIRARITAHRPSVVLIAGLGNRDWAQVLAGGELTPTQVVKGLECWTRETDGTLYLLTNHPVAWGIPNAYFEGVGRLAAGQQVL
jgi:hypothetical protein